MQEMKTCFVELFKPNISALHKSEISSAGIRPSHTLQHFFSTVKNGKGATKRTGSPRPPHRITAVVTIRPSDKWAQDAEDVNPARFDVASGHHWQAGPASLCQLSTTTQRNKGKDRYHYIYQNFEIYY